MLKQKKNQAAFTLIEIMIAMAIVSIVSSVMLVNFNAKRSQNGVEQSAREVASVVRQAQNYALTGKQTPAGGNPCSFDVTWGGVGTTNVLLVNNWNNSGACTALTILTYRLRDGVTLNGVAGLVSFSVPFSTVLSAVTIVVSKDGQSYAICVSTSGSVTTVSGSICP